MVVGELRKVGSIVRRAWQMAVGRECTAIAVRVPAVDTECA